MKGVCVCVYISLRVCVCPRQKEHPDVRQDATKLLPQMVDSISIDLFAAPAHTSMYK